MRASSYLVGKYKGVIMAKTDAGKLHGDVEPTDILIVVLTEVFVNKGILNKQDLKSVYDIVSLINTLQLKSKMSGILKKDELEYIECINSVIKDFDKDKLDSCKPPAMMVSVHDRVKRYFEHLDSISVDSIVDK